MDIDGFCIDLNDQLLIVVNNILHQHTAANFKATTQSTTLNEAWKLQGERCSMTSSSYSDL